MREPVTLQGRPVRLDPARWRRTQTRIRTPEEMRAYVETALGEQAEGRSLPFATLDAASGRAIGSTRFASPHRGTGGWRSGGAGWHAPGSAPPPTPRPST